MNKIILVSLLVMVLILVGAVGVVNADAKYPTENVNKLVGYGVLGTTSNNIVTKVMQTSFTFINPSNTSGITINKVSIWKHMGNFDIDPKIIYEGPFIIVWYEDSIKRAVLDRPIKPHEFFRIFLFEYMYTGLGSDPDDPTEDADWMDIQDALSQFSPYVVEVEWRSQGSNILIGNQGTATTEYYNSGSLAGNTYIHSGAVPMENIVQKGR